jgi:hypothetical protein
MPRAQQSMASVEEKKHEAAASRKVPLTDLELCAAKALHNMVQNKGVKFVDTALEEEQKRMDRVDSHYHNYWAKLMANRYMIYVHAYIYQHLRAIAATTDHQALRAAVLNCNLKVSLSGHLKNTPFKVTLKKNGHITVSFCKKRFENKTFDRSDAIVKVMNKVYAALAKVCLDKARATQKAMAPWLSRIQMCTHVDTSRFADVEDDRRRFLADFPKAPEGFEQYRLRRLRMLKK